MNILYLHGLESKLSLEKRNILEHYGKVLAPDIDYHNQPKAIDTIITNYTHEAIDAVIGSSMGGFAGYHVSNVLRRPALLFNPALKRRSVEQHIPEGISASREFKQIVLGLQDEVVIPGETISFLNNSLTLLGDCHFHLRHEMQHRVGIPCFQEEVDAFMTKIGV